MKKNMADGLIRYQLEDGRTIAAADEEILLEKDGTVFRNFEKDGIIKPYEDHRLPAQKRAADLANRLSREEIAGLMLYSSHQTVTVFDKYAKLFGARTYNGKTLEESGAEVSDLADSQRKFLKEGVRHVLVSSVENAETCAKWVNNMQAYCEKLPHGIPVNVCSDPRHGISGDAEYNIGSGSDISKWPEEIGLAASFDSSLVRRFGEVLAKEYRGLGIATGLSPQIDTATEPRWRRFNGTFGASVQMNIDMARAYVDGAQTSDTEDGWGDGSVNTMVKHWPGGATGEGGRDAHYCYGKYAVYQGNNFENHLKPFTEGAFRLEGKTGKASAVMPYYTVSYDVDPSGENRGNSYSRYIIHDLLREKYGYDGVVCTDWMITADHGPEVATFSGKCWGTETLSVAERHALALEAGVDQFGGNNDPKPLLEAFGLLEKKLGTEKTEERLRASAYRILLNIFRTGLYDDPYTDIQKTKKTVGCPEFTKEGYEAQKKSIVLLKNRDSVLPLARGTKVYIPSVQTAAGRDWFGNTFKAQQKLPVNAKIAEKYVSLCETPEEADAAVVIVRSPVSDGYDPQKKEYIPISLQYRPYTALKARKHSIAKGEPLENDCDRSYYGKTSKTTNESDLDMILNTKKEMNGKPVIVVIAAKKPMVVSEFEKEADAIVMHFGVQDDALFEILTGVSEPSGLLPFRMPADMDTVELHCEDLADDFEAYTDEAGNVYDFAFGMDYHGVIKDERTEKYSL